MKTIENIVISEIIELLDMPEATEITSETRLQEDLGIDSGLLLELFVAIEENVQNIEFDPAALTPENFATVGNLTTMLVTMRKEEVPA
ncbi:acyl carrier protein [Pseudovibrio ascidiaceicola]|uniref:acyl carrier protein n=1 Tax=Pseudovibrio ascidiaceicola TaxID=285279 RepID=UPI003D35BF74